jgi:hypothetical protein
MHGHVKDLETIKFVSAISLATRTNVAIELVMFLLRLDKNLKLPYHVAVREQLKESQPCLSDEEFHNMQEFRLESWTLLAYKVPTPSGHCTKRKTEDQWLEFSQQPI